MIKILIALLLWAGPVFAADLKVSTWNLEWLTLRPQGDPDLPDNVVPKRAEDRAMLRRYALQLDADVVGFQEVDGAQAAAEVFPPERYALFLTNDRVTQRVGFAVRRGLVVEQNPDLVGLDVTPNAVHRLRSGADITIVTPGGRLRLLNVHLKTGCHQNRLSNQGRNCQTLARQVAPLQGWIAQRRDEGAAFAPLARATEGQSTPCWGGNTFIDHILAGGAARGWMDPASLRVMVYRETDAASKERLSDHCAVSARFRLPG